MKITKPLKTLFIIILYTIFLANSSIFYIYGKNLENNTLEQNKNAENIILSAEAAVLIDAKTGVLLYEKNKDEKMYPASITKILTALIILENANLKDTIKASYNAIYNIGPGGSNMGLKENEEISLEDALYGILLKSANEACMVAAEHISGNVEKFVDLMNKRAKKIGAINSNFANPHGYHDNNHYTTAYDIALIMQEAIKNKEFVKYISTDKHHIPKTNLSDERILFNSNKLIQKDTPYYYEYCIGGKTGFTNQAGNTIVSYAKKDGMELICVILKSKGKESYNDSIKLFEYGFNQYENLQIFKKESFSKTVPVIQKFKSKEINLGNADLIAKENFYIKLPKNINIDNITLNINLNEKLNAPLSIGDKVGDIQFLYNQNLLGKVDIISNTKISSIPEKNLLFKEAILKIIKIIIKIIFIIILIIIFIIILGYISRKIFKIKRKRKAKKEKKY